MSVRDTHETDVVVPENEQEAAEIMAEQVKQNLADFLGGKKPMFQAFFSSDVHGIHDAAREAFLQSLTLDAETPYNPESGVLTLACGQELFVTTECYDNGHPYMTAIRSFELPD